MNTSSSDFSSGCDSGWTQYFVQSSSSKSRRTGSKKMMHNKGYGGGGGEEDMSMVSDASSGPRQYNEEEEQYNEDFNRNEYSSYRNINEQKMNKKGKQRDRSQTADTANSHSKNNQPSMYYSTSYVQENSEASLSKAKPTREKYFGS